MIPPLTIDEAIAAVQGEQPKLTPSKFVMDCSCCGAKTVAYRLRFRSPLIPALRAIVFNPLPTPELADRFSGAQARYIGRYFSELRFWGLIETRDGAWHVTPKGHGFLDGRISIPEHVWQRDKGPLPEYCTDGPAKFIHELTNEPDAHERIRVLAAVNISDGRAA